MTQEEAINKAKEVAVQEEWTWLEPVEATLQENVWTIRSNVHAMGMNAIVQIDDITGEVISKKYLPR